MRRRQQRRRRRGRNRAPEWRASAAAPSRSERHDGMVAAAMRGVDGHRRGTLLNRCAVALLLLRCIRKARLGSVLRVRQEEAVTGAARRLASGLWPHYLEQPPFEPASVAEPNDGLAPARVSTRAGGYGQQSLQSCQWRSQVEQRQRVVSPTRFVASTSRRWGSLLPLFILTVGQMKTTGAHYLNAASTPPHPCRLVARRHLDGHVQVAAQCPWKRPSRRTLAWIMFVCHRDMILID